MLLMNDQQKKWKGDYDQQGYIVIRNYFSQDEIAALRAVILTFYEAWKADNRRFYEEEAFNASLITGGQYLTDDERLSLFNFISSQKMMTVIDGIIRHRPAFMNTQLFFDPFNQQQANFWHRDCQYDYDIEDQKQVIQGTQVVHLRVPLFDEPGMELVPGSHLRWDNEEEFNVRQEENNRQSHESLSMGKEIPLAAGDLLVFAADMIHRGLYGLDRLAFDILVFDSAGNYADYVDEDCLPEASMFEHIENSRLFNNTLRLKRQS